MKVLQNWQKILFLCLKYVSVLQLIFYFKGKNFFFNCTLLLKQVSVHRLDLQAALLLAQLIAALCEVRAFAELPV